MRAGLGRALRRAVLFLVPALPAGAQAPQLYGPQPPAGSAFIRFVNATPSDLSVQPDFAAAQSLGTAPDARVSAYLVVERVANRSLAVVARSGDRSGRTTLHATAGQFVTVMVQAAPDGRLVAQSVPDPGSFNQARAHLAFYNAMQGCPAALRVAPDGPAIFDDVAPGTARTRTVNPALARLGAACGEAHAPPFALEGLEAGGRYSIWLLPGRDLPIAFLTRDAVPGGWQPGR
ncbi:ABC transporter permease [Muricoccus radiodurans]|uniref:ABC transporter permease n=1 Tax=Muricoccus radiodurans TaxID=2231721 RepID=UPI003CE811B7